MSAWLISGRLIDVILGFVAVEVAALVAYHGLSGRGHLDLSLIHI